MSVWDYQTSPTLTAVCVAMANYNIQHMYIHAFYVNYVSMSPGHLRHCKYTALHVLDGLHYIPLWNPDTSFPTSLVSRLNNCSYLLHFAFNLIMVPREGV